MPPVIYGCSAPGYPELSPAMVRAYNLGQLAPIAAGTPVALSDSPFVDSNLAALAAATSSSDAVCVSIINYFKPSTNLRDDADHIFIPDHEADNNTGISIATFAAAMAKFGTLCWPSIQAAYTHNVTWGPCFTGAWFGGGTDINGHVRNTAYRDSWLAGYTPDHISSDPYVDLTLVGASAAYAALRGYAWFIAECGATTGGTVQTDTQQLAHLQAQVDANNSLTNPAFVLLYFDNFPTLLNSTLNAASSAGATSIKVKTLPGADPTTNGKLPGGSQITIDPHGAHPETVTTTGAATGPAAGAYTVPVPSLGFAHAANAVVWLMPQTVAYLRAGPPQPGGATSFVQFMRVGVTMSATRKAAAVIARLLGHAPNTPAYLSDASTGFEDGTVGDWYTTGVAAPVIANTTAQAKAGIRSMQIAWPTNSGGGFLRSQAQVNFTANPGDVINATLWIYNPAGLPPVAVFPSGIFVFSTDSSVFGAWQQLRVTFVALGGVQALCLFPQGATTAGQVTYVDEVYLYRSAARSLGQRTATVAGIVVNPVEVVQQAAAFVRKVTPAVVARTLTGRFINVAVTQSPTRRVTAASTVIGQTSAVTAGTVRAAITATSRSTRSILASIGSLIVTQSKVTTVQAPAARAAARAAAALKTTQVPARSTRAAITGARAVTQIPAGRGRAAITAARAQVTAAALNLTETLVSLAVNVTATEPTTATLRQDLTAVARSSTTLGRRLVAGAGARQLVPAPPVLIARAAATATARAWQVPAARTISGIVHRPAIAVVHAGAVLVHRVAQRFLAAVTRAVPTLAQTRARGNPTPPDFTGRA